MYMGIPTDGSSNSSSSSSFDSTEQTSMVRSSGGTSSSTSSSSSDSVERTSPVKALLVSAVAFLPPAIVMALFSQVSPAAPAVLEALLAIPHVVGYVACAVMAAVSLLVWKVGYGGEPTVWLALMLPVGASAALCFTALPCLVPAVLTLGTAVWLGIAVTCIWRGALAHSFELVRNTLLAAAAWCLVVWGIWLGCRLPTLSKWTDWDEVFQQQVRDGRVPWGIAMVEWLVPLGISFELFLLAMLSWFQQSHLSVSGGDDPRVDGALPPAEQARLVAEVKLLGLVVCIAMMVLWIGASLDAAGDVDLGQARADLRGEVLGLTFWLFAGVGAWLVYNLGPDNVLQAAKTSKVAGRVLELAQSEWAKAGYLFCFAPFLLMHNIFQHCCGEVVFCERPLESALGLQEAVDVLKSATLFGSHFMQGLWTTSVLRKTQLLGIGYASFVVGIKATLLCLAYTNELLAGIDVMWVSLTIFLIGVFLFLLPPTPGPPVYGLVGIVITASAQNSGWSSGVGVCMAIAVGFAIKMCFAAIAQKFIGEPLAMSVQVRSMVQVHTAEIRAIEMILKEPGITAAKVAILIGGPDWPVAVLCGILRLSLCQIMLALSPVLLQSVVPCVLSGGVLVIFGDDEKKTTLGESAVAVAGGLQIVALIVAGYYIQEAMELHYDDLQKERMEDQDVLELEQQYAKQAEEFDAKTNWDILPIAVRCLLVCSLVCIYVSCMLLAGPWKMFLGKSCFKKFEITSSMDQALGGNPLAIVEPLGWVAIGFALASVLLLCIFDWWAKWKAGQPDAKDTTLRGKYSHISMSQE